MATVILDVLRNTARPTVVLECRRCGTTLELETDTCPYCGPTDVARYEIR